MAERVLITGGAGFIGSHLADELLLHGYSVRVLDNLSEQVHGPGRQWPDYLNRDVERMDGDVRDLDTVGKAVRGSDRVVHLAAMVGVGQSMYEIDKYTDVNNRGTAVLMEVLAKQPVAKLLVASSMSIYGEGLYRDTAGRLHHDIRRSAEQLKLHRWEPMGPDGEKLTPIATTEAKCPDLASVYALSKYDQEKMCLICGGAYGIPTTALRFFNVYGPRQALSNPYTGVLAIFAARYLNDKRPMIFEDGMQQRDFVSVHDVARGCRLALETPQATGQAFNIGSGQRYTVRQLAEELATVMNKTHIEPEITGNYRVGDIRHCFADITRAKRVLGYEPQVSLEQGMAELSSWLASQTAEDHVEKARAELATRGLTV